MDRMVNFYDYTALPIIHTVLKNQASLNEPHFSCIFNSFSFLHTCLSCIFAFTDTVEDCNFKFHIELLFNLLQFLSMDYKIYESRNQKTKLQSLTIFIIYNAFTYVCKNGHKNSPSAIEKYGVIM